MGRDGGIAAREASAALQARSVDRLRSGFRLVVAAEATGRGWDPRDAMIEMAPFVDCARRLGHDPASLLGPIAASGPDWYRQTFESFVARRPAVELSDFGWSLVDSPQGRAYRFAWPP
jgi:hypothetical protein